MQGSGTNSRGKRQKAKKVCAKFQTTIPACLLAATCAFTRIGQRIPVAHPLQIGAFQKRRIQSNNNHIVIAFSE